MRLYLHIGTEKTGTTSLQSSFFTNKDTLLENGIYIVQSAGEINNMNLPISMLNDFSKVDKPTRYFKNINSKESKIEFDKKVWACFEEEIKSLPEHIHTVIISSEHFQSLVNIQEEIQACFDFFSEFFNDIQVICYVRDQYNMLISSYSTTLKAGKAYSMNDYYKLCTVDNLFYNHFEMLNQWAKSFGYENIHVRQFSRGKLVDGDIVSDFYQNYIPSLDRSKLTVVQTMNVSLSNTGIFLLFILNKIFVSETKNGFSILNFKIKRKLRYKIIGKYFIGKTVRYQHLKEPIEQKFAQSNQLLKEKFLSENRLDNDLLHNYSLHNKPLHKSTLDKDSK